jgi:diguanylate cyclase (GGDEF)-like protein
VLPVVWLGVLGPAALGRDLTQEIGPTFTLLFGASAKALAVGFMLFNMLAGTLTPLAGASRTLSQLSDDGIFPRFLAARTKNGVPWAATLLTAAAALVFVSIREPLFVFAASNFAYVLAIGLPSVAVWLLRRDAPHLERPYRAQPGSLALGLAAAAIWAVSAIFGFEQFGLPAVVLGVAMVYSGAALYAWRRLEDRPRLSLHIRSHSIHLLVTAAMVAVVSLDGFRYYLAMRAIRESGVAFTSAALLDIYVVVALICIGAGLVLPDMIAVAATRKLAIVNARLRSGTEALRLEISERKQAELQLFHVANHDELTGLPNRKLFLAHFEELIARERGDGERYAAVLFVDLDGFKLVNDSLGHSAGDSLLVAVARCLERCIRPCDMLARLGGDEFIILLGDIDGECAASAFAEGVLAELAASFIVAGHEVFAAASIGIALTRIGDDLPEDVVRNADIAMYRAKQLGKQRHELFSPELLARAAHRLQLQEDLKRALGRSEFVLHYQPIVSLRNGELRGFEALIRWQHPERGFVPPDEFIPAAEESGEILAIGAWVIREACRQAALWREAYPLQQPLAINVNVSPRQFSSAEMLDEIKRSLATYDLGPEHLHVEITESAIMGDPESATATLLELRRLGIEVHLDDFGTGYSSLGHLHRFPVDTLKIDRSFISMSGLGVGNLAIVAAIASLAQTLSIETTAEGVETLEQFEHLRSLGCTSAQGYYFSKPVSAGDAGAIIESWRNPSELLTASLLQNG